MLLFASMRVSRVGKLTLGRVPAKACFVRSRLLSCFRLLAALSTSAISPVHEPQSESQSQTLCAANRLCVACWQQTLLPYWVNGVHKVHRVLCTTSSAIAGFRHFRYQGAHLCAMTRSAAIAGRSHCHCHR